MAEPDKRQLGDGSDSFSNAASNLSRAVNTMRQQASASSAGAAAAGAAKTGKAIAGAAKGAAAAGPWGALAAAAWSARHTLLWTTRLWKTPCRQQGHITPPCAA